MKKLFISLPVIGRTKQNIENSIVCMKKVAELMFDEELELIDGELELIDSYVKDIPLFLIDYQMDVEKRAIYSAKFLELLSQADYLIAIGPNTIGEQLIDMWNIASYPIETRYIETRDFKCFDDIGRRFELLYKMLSMKQ